MRLFSSSWSLTLLAVGCVFGCKTAAGFPRSSTGDWRLTIRDDARVYSDEEVALILREAAQLADSPPETLDLPSGLSLEQIKTAASEAGLDPVFVERAALRISQRVSESLFERVIGGPVRHRQAIHLPVSMGNEVSAHLLATVRAATDVQGEGRADSAGFYLHGWSSGNRLSVTAHRDSRGTRVQVLVDRGWAVFRTLFITQFCIVMPIWMVVEAVNSLPEVLVLAAIPVGVLAAARAYWKSSTRAVREKAAVLLETVRDAVHAGDEGRGI